MVTVIVRLKIAIGFSAFVPNIHFTDCCEAVLAENRPSVFSSKITQPNFKRNFQTHICLSHNV